MDFDQLTTFVQVAKLKSFSKAGQKVFRSQSAVSAQIRQLEQAYHAKLLDRSAKSVELTPAGEVLFEFAERLLRLRDESMQVVADRGNVVQGPVTFGANEATCLYLLPDILAEFQRRYPLVHISIYRNFSHKILQRLEEGSLDLGFLRMPFVGGPTVEVIPIHQEPFVMVVPSSHPLARKSAVGLREAAKETYVFYERAHAPGFHDLVLGILNRANVIPAVWQVAGEMPTLISLIASGIGISLLPVSAVKISTATVVGCKILDKIPISEIALASLEKPASAVVEQFKKFALANARMN